MRFPRRPTALALAAASWLVFGCGPDSRGGPAEEGPRRPMSLLILGLDGASWNVMEPMMERGALPNLARIREQGVSGTMRSELPCLSIVLWTSAATGRLPEEHGVRDWSYVDPETGEQGLMDSSRRQVAALWNIASAARLRVGFVNWWATWPAEEVNGFIVSEQYTRKRPGQALERGTFPESLAERLEPLVSEESWPWLEEQIGSGALRVLAERNPEPLQPDEAAKLQQAWFLYGQDHKGELAAFDLLSDGPHPDVLGLLSRKIDIASHYMWQFGETQRPSDDELSELLEPVYRYEDELLGRLLEQAGPDVNVVVLSDHGFTWEKDGWGHEESAPEGVFLAAGPAFRRGATGVSATLYDVLPTALEILELPLSKEFAGKPLSDALVTTRAEPRYVESYDGLVQEGRGAGASPLQERILEELRTLGYVP